ncbi:hypothetical protein D3C73_615180 [compost metagenome]
MYPVEQSGHVENLCAGKLLSECRFQPLHELLRTGYAEVIGYPGESGFFATVDPPADLDPPGGYSQPQQHFHVNDFGELRGPFPFHVPQYALHRHQTAFADGSQQKTENRIALAPRRMPYEIGQVQVLGSQPADGPALVGFQTCNLNTVPPPSDQLQTEFADPRLQFIQVIADRRYRYFERMGQREQLHRLFSFQQRAQLIDFAVLPGILRRLFFPQKQTQLRKSALRSAQSDALS